MPSVKTAISIQESLFKDIDALAQKMHVSRSQLFAKAVKEFVQKQQNRQLLQHLNIAYDDAPDQKERKWQQKARTRHRKLVKGQW